jgi:hypothetical protein
MDMDGVLTLRQVPEIQLHLDPVACGSEESRSYILTLGVLEVHFQTFVLVQCRRS